MHILGPTKEGNVSCTLGCVSHERDTQVQGQEARSVQGQEARSTKQDVVANAFRGLFSLSY